MKSQSEVINHLSIELTRTQMINKALINLLEKKNILTEKEVLEELNLIITETVQEYTSKIKEQYKNIKPEDPSEPSIFNFNKTGES
jgi:predicted transcriptional regulator